MSNAWFLIMFLTQFTFRLFSKQNLSCSMAQCEIQNTNPGRTGLVFLKIKASACTIVPSLNKSLNIFKVRMTL